MDTWRDSSSQTFAYSSHRWDSVQHKYSRYWAKMMEKTRKPSQLEQFLSRNGLSLVPLLLGILLGVATSTVLFLYPNSPIHSLTGWAKYRFKPTMTEPTDVQGAAIIRPKKLDEEIRIRQPLYVGVMTAEKFLTTRATAVNNTWGKYVDKMEFFAQKGTYEQYNLRLVNLDVDDSIYPPQQKVFAMLQYMCDHYIDDFDWFVRSDDDVYMKVGKLRELLSTMDRDKMIVLGQPGYGTPEEIATLGLEGINFCMGGPGVIFSRTALLKLCPYIEQCKRDVYSNQEDVEIGRCVTKHLGIQCTRAWDTLKLFYHAYKEDYGSDTPFTSDLENDIHFQSAITLHHAKQPPIMYNIHFYHLQEQYRALQQEINKYKEKLVQVEQVLNKTVGDKAKDPATESEKRASLWSQMKEDIDVPWNYFTKDAVYGEVTPSGGLKQQLQEAVLEGFHYLKSAKDDNVKIERFDRGYWRLVGSAGMQYMLDYTVTMGNPSGTNHLQELKGTEGLIRVHLLQAIKETIVQISPNEQDQSGIKIVVPFYIHKNNMFERYLKMLEDNVLNDKLPYKISILVIAFCEKIADNGNIPKLRELIDKYQKKYAFVEFKILFRTASKVYDNIEIFSAAMREESILSTDLILFSNPDVSFNVNFISRCNLNSQRGHVIFHAYPESYHISLSKDAVLGPGHVICGYGSDFKTNDGDMQKTEPLKFYDLFNSDVVVFKANDIGLSILS